MFSGLILSALAASAPAPDLHVSKIGSSYQLRLGTGKPFRTTSTPVSKASTMRLSDGWVVGFWQEGAEGRYLVSKNGSIVLRETTMDDQVHLQAATFDPLKALPTASEAIPTPASNEVYVVQFKTQPLPTYLEEIVGLGGISYDTVAPNAAIMRIPSESLAAVRALGFVRWVGAYEAAFRLDPTLRPKLEAGTLGTRRYNIWCHQRGPGMQDSVAQVITTLGGRVEQATPQGFIISATLTPLQLSQVLGLNEVSYIDAWSAPSQDMNVVRAWQGANYIETNLGFTGQGVRAEVMDGGLLTTHVAWTNPPIVHAPSLPVDSHGTATFGINFGNGNSNAAGRGLLPNGQGVMANYNAMSGGNRYTHTAELLTSPRFCVYQSNSWGNAQTTAYTTISAEMDDILFLNDVTILNSQSNTGNQTSRPQAWAKNIVSIGGAWHFNTASTADDRWNGGASIGPASDGRYKPELANCYDNITCPTSSSTTAYTTGFNGTSAATPITAGHFGLFFQMWHNGVFGNPAPATTVFDNRPKSQFAKAFMINNANQYTLPAPFDITRNVQGWGVVSLNNVYDNRQKLFYINETDVLTNLQTSTHKVVIGAGTPALRVTMSYLEPQGSPTPAIARKNNLSLKVTGPTGTIWWGNSGMANSNWTSAGGVEDSINTVENVFIQNPGAGTYTVQVIGTDINTDARTETSGVIDADFALVATGVVNLNLPPSAFTVLDGGLVSGGLSDLSLSDNLKINATRGANGSRFFKSQVELTYSSPITTINKMTFTIERSNAPGGVAETIEAREVATGNWIPVGTGSVGTADALNAINVTNPQRFLAGDGSVRFRCTYTRQDTNGSRTGPVGIDYARLMIEP